MYIYIYIYIHIYIYICICVYQKQVIKTHIFFVNEFSDFTSFRHHVYHKLFNDLPNTVNFLKVTIAAVNKK